MRSNHLSLLWIALLCLGGLATLAIPAHAAQDETPAKAQRAWQRTDTYSPPDFEGFFPNDEAGGRALDGLYASGEYKKLDDAAFIEAFRKGMRRKTEYNSHLTRILATRFLWRNKTGPQNADAIELFYHMSDGPGLRKYAIKNGLTYVNEPTPAILHAMLDMCVHSDLVKDLERMLEYCKGHEQTMLPWLEPHIRYGGEGVRAKALDVQAMLLGKLTPKQWSMRPKPTLPMPGLRKMLREGTSAERAQAMEELNRTGAVTNLGPDCLPDLALAAKDENYRVRKQVVQLTTRLAVADANRIDGQALLLLLELSHDPDQNVRESVVYDAFRTHRIAQTEMGRTRMLEMVVDPLNGRSHDDLLAALRRSGKDLHARLCKEIAGADKKRAWTSYELYLRVFEQLPPEVPEDIYPPSELTGTWQIQVTAPPTQSMRGGFANGFTIPKTFHQVAPVGEEFQAPLFQNLLWKRMGDTLHLSCNAYIEGIPVYVTARLQGDNMHGTARLPGGKQQFVWKASRSTQAK